MKILGIECTAHTLGAAVFEKMGTGSTLNRKNGFIRSNESDKYPAKKEGFLPRKLADHHARVFRKVIGSALDNAQVKMPDLDAIAYSYGPGLGHCLHVGYVGALSLAELSGKQLIPVNHTVAHCEVGRWWFGYPDPLVVYVSGGNTQLAAIAEIRGKRAYRVIGETLDVGIGNFLDVLARSMELSPPDAVGLIKCAKTADSRKLLELPYTVKGMDLAFSGLLTACQRAVAAGEKKEDVCFSAQETSFAMLVEACERAICHTRKRQILLVGGVAQNRRLQEMVRSMAAGHDVLVGVVPPELAGDNAGMIALTAAQMLMHTKIPEKTEPDAGVRLDSTQISW